VPGLPLCLLAVPPNGRGGCIDKVSGKCYVVKASRALCLFTYHRETRRNTLTLTCLAGLAGLPQVTVPLAQVVQCPLGISLVAAPGRDMILLSYAKQVTEMSLG
jgi:hypothetical protein